MSRQRWWCSFCGQLTEREPDPRDEKVRCFAHSTLPVEVDLIEPDPLESLPMQAASFGEDVQAARERGA